MCKSHFISQKIMKTSLSVNRFYYGDYSTLPSNKRLNSLYGFVIPLIKLWNGGNSYFLEHLYGWTKLSHSLFYHYQIVFQMVQVCLPKHNWKFLWFGKHCTMAYSTSHCVFAFLLWRQEANTWISLFSFQLEVATQQSSGRCNMHEGLL